MSTYIDESLADEYQSVKIQYRPKKMKPLDYEGLFKKTNRKTQMAFWKQLWFKIFDRYEAERDEGVTCQMIHINLLTDVLLFNGYS